jgi:hypothetical protein
MEENMPTPPKVDYSKLTPTKLRDLKRRYEEQGYPELAQLCANELETRGAAKHSDYAHLKWNQVTVETALRPFSELAIFEGNRRTNYTSAGGAKIGRKKTDPERCWVDSYAGMSQGTENWIFVCQIKRPGGDPIFTLRDHGVTVETFNADGLETALERWSMLATKTKAALP